MAEVVELSNIRELTKAELGQITIPNPVGKIRLHFNFLPDFTIDLEKPGRGITAMLAPRATVLLKTGQAISLNPYSKEKIRFVSHAIFNQPTAFDSILSMGIIPFIGLTVSIGYILYKLLGK